MKHTNNQYKKRDSKGSLEFDPPLRNEKEIPTLCKSKRFSFVESHSAKLVPINYRNIKIVKGERWYVEYYFKQPLELGGKWQRFRVFEDINRRKGEEKEEYAQLLWSAVKEALSNGFDPFKFEYRYFVKKELIVTLSDALDYALLQLKEKGLEVDTLRRYERVIEMLKETFPEITPDELTDVLIIKMLNHYKTVNKFGNRQWNNLKGYLSTVLNLLVTHKKMKENPCDRIPKLKSISKKHKYYEEDILKKVLKWMKENDPYLLLAAQTVYYAGVRSAKELISLQVEDILFTRNRIRFKGTSTKGKREDYIVLDPKLKQLFIEAGIDKQPGEYYIFQLGPNKSGESHLQRRYAKLREDLKLSSDYTLYSFKHTRAIHILMDGGEPIDIMQLFRHTDLSTTTKYIRDLGFSIDAKFTEKSRII